jgi:hypothetical protein
MLIGNRSVTVLMVNKDASWQQGLVSLLPPDGAAVVEPISRKGLQCSTLIAVSLINHPCLWETQSVVMGSEREMRSVTVVMHRSALILAAIQPRVS